MIGVTLILRYVTAQYVASSPSSMLLSRRSQRRISLIFQNGPSHLLMSQKQGGPHDCMFFAWKYMEFYDGNMLTIKLNPVSPAVHYPDFVCPFSPNNLLTPPPHTLSYVYLYVLCLYPVQGNGVQVRDDVLFDIPRPKPSPAAAWIRRLQNWWKEAWLWCIPVTTFFYFGMISYVLYSWNMHCRVRLKLDVPWRLCHIETWCTMALQLVLVSVFSCCWNYSGCNCLLVNVAIYVI